MVITGTDQTYFKYEIEYSEISKNSQKITITPLNFFPAFTKYKGNSIIKVKT